MRCKSDGCMNMTRSPNKTECWKKFQKCRACCIEQGLVENSRGYRVSSRDESHHQYREFSHLCEIGYHQNSRTPQTCKGTVCKCECHKEILIEV